MPPAVIWYRDPYSFLSEASATQFYPARDDTLADQLNAVMRFALYLSIILTIVKRDTNALFIAVLVGAFTFVVHEMQQSREGLADRRLKKLRVEARYRGKPYVPGESVGAQTKPGLCVRPTRDNPFMNVSLTDLTDFPNRPAACPPSHRDVKRRMEEEYRHNLYRDTSDVFGRKSSSRQFFTQPVTTVPNDQTGFAEWLYKPPRVSCKEGNGLQCERNQSMLYVPSL